MKITTVSQSLFAPYRNLTFLELFQNKLSKYQKAFALPLLYCAMLLLLSTTTQAQCPTPPGNPATYGTDSWIGYVYSGSSSGATALASTYRGYVTQSAIFNYSLGTSPIAGPNLCGSYSNLFAVRYRMKKNFPAGNYTLLVGGDDGYRLSVDGGATFIIDNWTDHGYTTTSQTVSLSGSTNLVLEYYEQNGDSQVSFAYGLCSGGLSTMPTTVTGANPICLGNAVTLTASGGTEAVGALYQWGHTGVGNNIIVGETSATITVTPSVTTTYWVRRIDSACVNTTGANTYQVTVRPPSTAPTAIANSSPICLGNSIILTASGGTAAPGSIYEWGTGNVAGSNIITGQNNAAITVAPTTTTTYWVRRKDNAVCGTTSDAFSTSVTVTIPAGNQTDYGLNSWIGYVYNSAGAGSPPATPFATYQGYITQTESFNQNLGYGALSDPNLCSSYLENFGIRFKMQKNFTPGYYNFTVGGDDGVRLSLDGGATFPYGGFVNQSYNTYSSGTIFLSGMTSLVLEYYEQTGASQVSFSYTACTTYSTAPTDITGVKTVCLGLGTSIMATGGYNAPGSSYQWGTGTVGNNIIGGQTSNSIYVSPTSNTTYWVRKFDPICNAYTTSFSTLVSVTPISTAPTSITGTNTICEGGSTTLTANGGTLATGSVYQWGTGYTPGVNIISGDTQSITVTPSASTVYWVRRINGSPCTSQTGGVSLLVNVRTLSTTPITISGNTCAGTGGTTLTATGGVLGSNGTYQWGTGSVVGSNVVSSNSTYASLFVNPTAETVYWVRRIDGTPCSVSTDGIFVTVYKASTAPNNISGTATICSGNSTTLTATGGASGSNSSFEWGTGNTVGDNIIAGESDATISVSPTATTIYWVRRVDSAPCNSATVGRTFTVNVQTNGTAPTSISGVTSLCFGTGGTTLTAVGGVLGSNGRYQWGTGSVIGVNPVASTVSTLNINPSTTTTYWVRIFNGALCSNYTDGTTVTVDVSIKSSAPSSIVGTATICAGGSTTLTASGGTLSADGVYQWGTGTTVGSNVIAGSGVSIVVSPSATTTYWVNRIDSAPCNTQTTGVTRQVVVTIASSAPTSISSTGSVNCSGNSITLTATGGTAAAGSTYQWGTGTTIGSNIIAGTGVSISVSPTANTTYWVRRKDNGTCAAFTTGVTTLITISSTSGDPAIFGDNQWNVYGYSTGDITLTSAIYAGYYTQSTLGFDTTASWIDTASPSSASNWTGCPVPVENFTFVHKRKGFPCGTYELTMANWDDATELYLNGTKVWSCENWFGGNTCTGTIGTYNLDANSEIEVRTREINGNAVAKLNLVNTNVSSTAPTSITGIGAICSGASTTLTATGGVLGTTGVYQWGTGATVGQNILVGATSSSIVVSPTAITSYWVRRMDTLCNFTTSAIVQALTMVPPTIAGTVSTPATTICKNTRPRDLTLTGNLGSVIKWQSASDAAFTVDVIDINVTSTVMTGAQIGNLSDSRYFRAVVQNGSCLIKNSLPISIIIPNTIIYNGSWSGIPTATTPVIINSDITLSNNMTMCSCKVAGTATITVPADVTLTVQGEVFVTPNAQIIIENNGSLVQVDDSSANIGSIVVKRNTAPMKQFDFTYWSSPVQNFTLQQLSPNTLSDKYFSYSAITNGWVGHPGGNHIMEPAKGYIVRAPQGWSQSNATGGVYNAVFTGIPNTGVVPAVIQKGPTGFNLIGNPYPSAIDIDLFLLDPANAGITNGTVYLWSHNTGISNTIPGNSVYNYTRDDYAKYNITGGVKTASASITGGAIPTGKIASGQSFFIEANTALGSGNYTATFRNNIRVAGNNDQFFRMASSDTVVPSGIEKHRIWLNISNTAGAYDEMLLGYIQGATNEIDNLYDGKTFPAGNVVGLYSLLNDVKLSIQGRALPFSNDEVIPLGFTTTIAGAFAIQLEDFDGIFENENVYLHDMSDDTYHNLKDAAYSFSAEIGTYNTRFELRFIDGTLGINNPTITENEIKVIKNGKTIGIDAGNYIMENVSIFDMTGKQLFRSEKINASTFNITDLNFADQVLVVKITFDNKETISKKVIMN